MSELDAATEAAVSCNPFRKLCQVCGLLVGALLAIALIVYAVVLPVYEARCEFTLEMGGKLSTADMGFRRESGSYSEIFTNRTTFWRTEKMVARVVGQYRSDHPDDPISDQELIDTLTQSSQIDLIRKSRLIVITVRSTSPRFAAALADAYAEAIKSFTDEENKDRCDHAVREIALRIHKQRRVDEDITRRFLKFKSEHDIDAMKARRASIENELQGNSVDEKRNRDLEEQKRVLDQNVISAEAGLRQLKKAQEVSTMMLMDLMQRENEVRNVCERYEEVVTVLRRAEVPTRPANSIPKLFWLLTGGRCYAK